MISRRWLALGLAVALAVGIAGQASATADTSPTRVMFIGDSITGSPGCWRAPVWVGLTDDGYDVDMVGPRTEDECGGVTNAAGEVWDPDNLGIGAITTTKMWVKIARDQVLETYRPDVIVQLLGTNDLLGGATVDDIRDQYDKLLELYRTQNPQVRVVVGTPPPIDPGKCSGCEVTQAALATAIPLWATAASTPQSPVTYADLSTGFDTATMTADGIHPNDSGNAFLAAAWLPPLEAALEASPAPASASASPAPSPVATDTYPPATPSMVWVAGGLVLVLVGVGVIVARRRGS